jgi:hypothetical protein
MDFFEQKGTKATKQDFFFVAFVCFCGNRFPRVAERNPESVKSAKSVVQFPGWRVGAAGLALAKLPGAKNNLTFCVSSCRVNRSQSNAQLN